MQALDAMLDEALAGTFTAGTYDESTLSRMESKLARFLEQSRLSRVQLEEERAQVRSLISDISHQTKTPLANIELYAGLLAEQELTERQAGLTGQLADSSEKLNFLIQSLVKASRLESGIIKIEAKPGDVYTLAKSAVDECGAFAAAKGITLSLAPCASQPSALYDFRWCTEALLNILENAVKYTPENGCVDVSVSEYEMFARVDVSDTGCGIREEDLPRLFKRFWRAADAAKLPGTGLGLYLAREIITACGGYIKAESKYGSGSCFSVFLSKV
jgi:signal transduction histidine kinase